MKTLVTHWILLLCMSFTFMWAATSKPDERQVLVRVDPGNRHHYRNPCRIEDAGGKRNDPAADCCSGAFVLTGN